LQADLADAVEIIQGVLHEANAAIDKETRQNALTDLHERVEEWKSLKVDSFGELLLFGTFTVQKGDGSKDQEKEVCIRRDGQYLLLANKASITSTCSRGYYCAAKTLTSTSRNRNTWVARRSFRLLQRVSRDYN
jgi:hypothetical protein